MLSGRYYKFTSGEYSSHSSTTDVAWLTLDAKFLSILSPISQTSFALSSYPANAVTWGRYFLSTGFHNLTLYSPGYTQHLSLTPFIRVPRNTSFQYQRRALETCPSTLRYSIQQLYHFVQVLPIKITIINS